MQGYGNVIRNLLEPGTPGVTPGEPGVSYATPSTAS